MSKTQTVKATPRVGRPPKVKDTPRDPLEDSKNPHGAEVAKRDLEESAKNAKKHLENGVKEMIFPPAWKLPPSWSGRNLFVAFPSYKFTNPVTAWCLQALAVDLGREFVQFHTEFGDAMIYHARNVLAERFMASEAEWCLMIDDDMILPIGRPELTRQMARLPQNYPAHALELHVAHRLIGHGKTLVGATYWARHMGGQPVNSLRNDAGYLAEAADFSDRVMSCDWVGTGCLLIHRKVFEDMKEKFPELAPNFENQPFNYFQPGQDGRGEDIAFCHRAIECGHDPHVDVRLQALHVGFCAYGQHTSSSNRVGL